MAPHDPTPVYAVVRLDRFLGPGAPPEETLTVKEILPTLEEAKKEVVRLNGLSKDDGVVYFVQATRWFPTGRKIPDSPDQ
jgi:hypothetical protein